MQLKDTTLAKPKIGFPYRNLQIPNDRHTIVNFSCQCDKLGRGHLIWGIASTGLAYGDVCGASSKWFRKAQPTVVSATFEQVILGCLRKIAELWEKSNQEQHSSLYSPSSLDLNFCLIVPWCWTTICKITKPFLIPGSFWSFVILQQQKRKLEK